MSRTEEFGAESRGQTFRYLPERLVIVTDPGHPLFDPTAEDPPPQWLVDSIAQEGVLTPITVRKNGYKRGKPIIEVVAGRNRVKATKLVNQDRKKAGEEPLTIEATYRRTGDAQAMTHMVIENELRKVEDHVTRAKKLERWLDFHGQDEKAARKAFGLKYSEMRTLLSILEMDADVQKALKSKRITLSIAKKLSTLPRSKQRRALDAVLMKNGKGRGPNANEQTEGEVKNARPRSRPFKQLQQALEEVSCMPDSDYQRGVRQALKWAMGQLQVEWTAMPASSPIEEEF